MESEFRRTHQHLPRRFLRADIDFAECPVEASLGVLGKKWAIVMLRDIGIYGQDRFSLLRRSLPRIPQKVLATRLGGLEKEGLIVKLVEKSTPPKVVRWSLTERGFDALRIGIMISVYGSKWHADRVFDDRVRRTLQQLYTREGIALLLSGTRRGRGASGRPAPTRVEADATGSRSTPSRSD